MTVNIFKKLFITVIFLQIVNANAFAKDFNVITENSIQIEDDKSNVKNNNKDKNDQDLTKSQKKPESNFIIKGFHTSIAIEKARGFSQENVYDNNKKISELNWNYRDVKMARLNIGINIQEYFKINASYASSFNNSSKSYMTDYDWMGSPGGDDGNKNHNDWTHYSYSKTRTEIHEFDINTSSNFFKYFDVILGYREHRFNFSDSLQNLNYSCTQSEFNRGQCSPAGLRNIQRQYNGVNAVDYYQRFKIPYLGTNFKYEFLNNKLKLNIYGAYSNIVSAYSKDHHVLRNLEIVSKFNKGKYYNFGTNIGYLFHKNISVNLGYDYFEIPEIRGDSFYNYYSENIRFTNLNGAGMSNKTQRVSLGLKYEY